MQREHRIKQTNHLETSCSKIVPPGDEKFAWRHSLAFVLLTFGPNTSCKEGNYPEWGRENWTHWRENASPYFANLNIFLKLEDLCTHEIAKLMPKCVYKIC